ncbi:P protein [Eptesicus fuscus rhabdovirus]|uniref:P protein n=1 Tax=Eptesicus fuscus rhabdovirus TaxID=2793798 RepID=A0A7T1KMU2_9RHAB|nr:P protein [Eptesicus fuscus rhabdovirus]
MESLHPMTFDSSIVDAAEKFAQIASNYETTTQMSMRNLNDANDYLTYGNFDETKLVNPLPSLNMGGFPVYSAFPSQIQPTFVVGHPGQAIPMSINTSVPPPPLISVPAPSTSLPQAVHIVSGQSQLDSRQRGSGKNPFLIDKRYRYLVPAKTYHGNDDVKKALLLIQKLPSADQKLLNTYFQFQIETLSEKIILKHNQEIESLKERIEKLSTELKNLKIEETRELNPTDDTDLNIYKHIKQWDTASCLSLWGNLTEIAEEAGGNLEDTNDNQSPSDMPYETFKNMSIIANTKIGRKKLRVGEIHGFVREVYEILVKKRIIEVLKTTGARSSGLTYNLIVLLILRISGQDKSEDSYLSYGVTGQDCFTSLQVIMSSKTS